MYDEYTSKFLTIYFRIIVPQSYNVKESLKKKRSLPPAIALKVERWAMENFQLLLCG